LREALEPLRREPRGRGVRELLHDVLQRRAGRRLIAELDLAVADLQQRVRQLRRLRVLLDHLAELGQRLAELAATTNAVLVLEKALPDVVGALRELEQASDVESFTSTDGFPAYRIFGQPETGGALGPAIYDLARAHEWPVRELRRDTRTLEMVFNELATAGEVTA